MPRARGTLPVVDAWGPSRRQRRSCASLSTTATSGDAPPPSPAGCLVVEVRRLAGRGTTCHQRSPPRPPRRQDRVGLHGCGRAGRRPELRRLGLRPGQRPAAATRDRARPVAAPTAGRADVKPRQVGERAGQLESMSLEMGLGYAKSARRHAPPSVICIDPYHAVALAIRALDEVRRTYWKQLRQSGDQHAAKRFKDARGAAEGPAKLTDNQTATQAPKDRRRRGLTRRHAHGSRPRDLRPRAQRRDSHRPAAVPPRPRTRIEPLIRLRKTIRTHVDGISPPRAWGINKGRTEAINNKVMGLMTRYAYGFHSAEGALALVMLTSGPIALHLPHQLHVSAGRC
jgi:hypothetical protein